MMSISGEIKTNIGVAEKDHMPNKFTNVTLAGWLEKLPT